MSDAIDAKPFPSGVLLAAGALVATSIACAALAQITGIGATRVADVPAIEQRSLKMISHANGNVDIFDANTGIAIATLSQNKFGFIAVVLKAIHSERMRAGVDIDAPVRLERLSGGRTAIDDPLTGHKIMLDAFGPDNHTAFSQIFAHERIAP